MKKVLIIGLGKSGLAAQQLLSKQGREVIGYDDAHAQNPSIHWEEIEQVIVSPGVSPEHPLYSQAKALQIEVIGEAELALRYLIPFPKNKGIFGCVKAPNFHDRKQHSITPYNAVCDRENSAAFTQPNMPLFFGNGIKQRAVAITGTNGKTTVTLLTAHVLNTVGIPARAVGNIGEPLCVHVMNASSEEVFVVELSSFQIETLSARVFDAAVLLNITPDHLDRYNSLRDYAYAKCALQRCLKEGASFFVQDAVAQVYGDLFTEPIALFNQTSSLTPLDLPRHDKENALASYVLCRCFGVSETDFLHAFNSFQKPPHRIEFVSEIDGVCYYDDSKGTNIDAVIQAVYAMRGPVILIVGGVDKGASYLPWVQSFKGKVKQIIALGQAAEKIGEELKPFFALQTVNSLSAAVELARSVAVCGDAVLLSPGCSSFDMFRDYVQRGEEFQRCVRSCPITCFRRDERDF